jgi:hypothetical protein
MEQSIAPMQQLQLWSLKWQHEQHRALTKQLSEQQQQLFEQQSQQLEQQQQLSKSLQQQREQQQLQMPKRVASSSSISRRRTSLEDALPMIAFFFSSPLVRSTQGNGNAGANGFGVRGNDGGMEQVVGLDYQKEKEMVWGSMEQAKRRIGIKMEVCTADTLRDAVTLGCRVLHYVGHGTPSHLVLERSDAHQNGTGEAHFLDHQSLKRLFSAGGGAGPGAGGTGCPGDVTGGGVKLAFVSACHSQGAGQAFVQAGVPHVVAIHSARRVSDKASHIFARSFYLALFKGRTVRQSFEIGQASVEAHAACSAYEAEAFELFPQLQISEGSIGAHDVHDVPLFDDAEGGGPVDFTPLPPPSRGLDSGRVAMLTDRQFVGRHKELQRVVAMLNKGAGVVRCVKLRGEEGIGKTALVLKVCEYMRLRGAPCCSDGICFIPLQQQVLQMGVGSENWSRVDGARGRSRSRSLGRRRSDAASVSGDGGDGVFASVHGGRRQTEEEKQEEETKQEERAYSGAPMRRGSNGFGTAERMLEAAMNGGALYIGDDDDDDEGGGYHDEDDSEGEAVDDFGAHLEQQRELIYQQYLLLIRREIMSMLGLDTHAFDPHAASSGGHNGGSGHEGAYGREGRAKTTHHVPRIASAPLSALSRLEPGADHGMPLSRHASAGDCTDMPMVGSQSNFGSMSNARDRTNTWSGGDDAASETSSIGVSSIGANSSSGSMRAYTKHLEELLLDCVDDRFHQKSGHASGLGGHGAGDRGGGGGGGVPTRSGSGGHGGSGRRILLVLDGCEAQTGTDPGTQALRDVLRLLLERTDSLTFLLSTGTALDHSSAGGMGGMGSMGDREQQGRTERADSDCLRQAERHERANSLGGSEGGRHLRRQETYQLYPHLHEQEKVVDIGPLTDYETATLFAKLAPQPLKLQEMIGNGSNGHSHPLVAFSTHPVIQAMHGHPSTVVKTAPLLQDTGLKGVEMRLGLCTTGV